MREIKIDNGDRKIKVNDAVIVLHLGDQKFSKDLYDYVKDMPEELQAFEKRLKVLSKEEKVKQSYEYQKKFVDRTDALFGFGICKKMFRIDVPSIDMIYEFIDGIIPELEKYRSEKEKKMKARYNPGRAGNV